MTAAVVLYSAVDDVVTRYTVDVQAATLTKLDSVRVPAKVQYAWRPPTHNVLYVSTSNGGPRVASNFNHVSAYCIAPDGALHALGEPKPLPRRAVHLCVDPTGRYILNGHNFPSSSITVHEIGQDGSVGRQVEQDGTLDFGVYPHQIMVFPHATTALIVDRGNKAQDPRPEDPGALRTFEFNNGKLSRGQVIAPNAGYGFGPRHVAFHPSQNWVYASDERTNRLYMFRYSDAGLENMPAYTRDLLARPDHVAPRQMGGPIHVHPSGRWVYVANRADHTVDHAGIPVFSGGENSIAVFAIDPETGEPTLLQHADTASFHVRTFSCDPSGKLLVTASIRAVATRDHHADRVTFVPAALTVFRVSDSGALEFARKYDVVTEGKQLQYWMTMTSVGA